LKTGEMCLEAVKQGRRLLKFVPEALRTEAVYLTAGEQYRY